jgi:hypothetical protein
VTAIFATSAARVEVMSPRLNRQMAALMPPTIAAIKNLQREGQHGPYYVTWLPEPQAIGAEGYTVLNELLRHGIDARAGVVFRPGATRYHTVDAPDEATLRVHLATGIDIERWRVDPRYTQVASFDPRSDAERVEFDRLHREAVAALTADGHPELVRQLDDNLFMLAISPAIPAATRRLMSGMLDLGFPAAIFVGPTDDPRPITPP